MVTALVSGVPVAAIYSGLPLVVGNHESQDVLIAMAQCCLKVEQTSVENEIFLSSGILVLDLVRHSPLEKLGNSAMVIFQMLQPLCGESDNWLTLLS